MDVARFKYPVHWVKLDLLYKSMKDGIDKATGKCRGYFILTRRVNIDFNLKLPFDKVSW